MSDHEVLPEFGSAQQEIDYWKSKALETREELDEYQESSKELEAELETQLEQAESRLKDFRSLSNRLQMENDQIKDKLDQCQRDYHYQVTELQKEITDIKSIRDELSKYVRDLEQKNDDLERAKRSTVCSLEDFESRLNAAIERNAFLESELDEKESLKANFQRMKDEMRDLKSELRVLAPRHPNLSSLDSSSFEVPDNDRRAAEETNNNGAKSNSDVDSNKLAEERQSKQARNNKTSVFDSPPSSSKSSPKGLMNGRGNPLTPTARNSALNIVGDLLRKVGALELKLVSCRNLVKENGPNSTINSVPGTPIGASASSPNGQYSLDCSRKIPRGMSTPSLKKILD